MAMLRRLGRLAGVLLDDQLARGRAREQSDLIEQRQKDLAQQGLLDNMAKTLGPLLAQRKLKIDAVPAQYKDMLAPYAAAAPSDTEAAADASSPIYKEIAGAKSNEDLGSEDARLAQAKSAFTGVNVPLTSGDDNPMWAMQDAFRAQQGQVGKNIEAATARDTAKTQSDYNITHPDEPEKVVFQSVDANGKPSGPLMVQDPSSKSGYRPATAEDKFVKGQVHYIEGHENPYLNAVAGGPLDDATIDMNAKLYVKSGGQYMPTLYGATGNAVKKAILKRASQYDASTDTFTVGGDAPDLASNRVDFGAGVGAVNQLTKNISAVGAFKKTADKNAALLKGVMNGIPSQNMPTFVNSKVRDLAQTFGDKSMSAFKVALNSVGTEYARLITQPNLTGVLTNEARAKMDAALDDNATVGQVLEALDILQKESANREAGFNEQLAQTKKGLPGGNVSRPGASTPTLPPGVTVTRRQ